MRSILAVTDLSRHADESIRAAGTLALRTGAELHVVLTAWLLQLPARQVLGALLRPRRHEGELLKRLDAQLERALPPGVALASRVVESRSRAPAILGRARTVRADTIVMVESSPGRVPLDPTFREVMERATVPCLVPRGRLALPARRAAMPIRSRQLEPHSFDSACRWIAASRARLAQPADPTELELVQMVRIGYQWATASRVIRHRVERLQDDPQLRHAVRTRWRAVPAESARAHLRAMARRTDLDLLVVPLPGRGMGVSRRSRLDRATRRLLADATAPVLLLPFMERLASGDADRDSVTEPVRLTIHG